MSELTSYNSERIYWAVEQVEREAGDIDDLHLDDNLFYLKSEADKVIAHQKYKRCLAMAKWCKSMMVFNDRYGTMTKWLHYNRWHKRWLELAEQFKDKEAK